MYVRVPDAHISAWVNALTDAHQATLWTSCKSRRIGTRWSASSARRNAALLSSVPIPYRAPLIRAVYVVVVPLTTIVWQSCSQTFHVPCAMVRGVTFEYKEVSGAPDLVYAYCCKKKGTSARSSSSSKFK